MSSSFTSSPPDGGSLYQAALNYLARYAATESGLRRVLVRQVDRWARAQVDTERAAPMVATARVAIDEVVRRLVEAGALSDAAFAESRAKSLVRGGQSNRVVQARLIAKGVAPDVARAASQRDTDTELAAALVLARKRRIGPYRMSEDPSASAHMKELGLLARAGYARDIAEQLLTMTRDEAEKRIFDLRQS